MIKGLLLFVFTILILYSVQAQDKIKFNPVSSKTSTIIPRVESDFFEGINNNPTELFEENGMYYLMVNDLVGGWPSKKINVGLLYSKNLEKWNWSNKPLFSSIDLPYKLNKPHGLATSIIKKGDTYYVFMDVLDNASNIGIGLASSRSLDGPWNVHKDIILKSRKGKWDSVSVMGAEVIVKDGEFWMYYVGVINNKPKGYGETAVGLAKSKDGVHWIRENEPVLSKSKSGFDSHKIGTPKVIKNNDEFWMLYRTDDADGSWGSNSAYGIAKSKDGKNWVRCQEEPVIHENDIDNWYTVWASGFLKVGNTFHLFLEYDGPPLRHTRVTHAIYKAEK